MTNKKITLLSCGGTIDKYQFVSDIDEQIGAPQILPILKQGNASIEFEHIELMRKDSINIKAEERSQIKKAVSKIDNNKIIITHGTDTLIDTAQELKSFDKKTIVLTGAMTPRLLENSDAIFNVGSAVMAVQTLSAGVYIVMHGKVFDPDKCKKDYDKYQFVETK